MNSPNDILSKNIRYLMTRSGISSPTELARRLKINQPTLHRLLSGEVKDPRYVMLKQIAGYFQVSAGDLIEKDLRENPGTGDNEAAYIALKFSKVPVLGNARLGFGEMWSDAQYPVITDGGYICWQTKDDDAYALKCAGDSLVPRIKEGEFVIVEPGHRVRPGDEVLIVTKEGDVMLKTFMFERDGFYHLLSVNEDHPPVRLLRENVLKIHYIAGIAKPALHLY